MRDAIRGTLVLGSSGGCTGACHNYFDQQRAVASAKPWGAGRIVQSAQIAVRQKKMSWNVSIIVEEKRLSLCVLSLATKIRT